MDRSENFALVYGIVVVLFLSRRAGFLDFEDAYEGDNEELWNAQELSCARWAWSKLRELMVAGLVEVRWTPSDISAQQQAHGRQGWSRERYGVETAWSDRDLPLTVLWVRLKHRDAEQVWARVG